MPLKPLELSEDTADLSYSDLMNSQLEKVFRREIPSKRPNDDAM